jgi:hypothetical protein
MATTANSKLQITNLDFTNIKTNLIDFLRSQETFRDYNFSGSALNTLLDVLAYNTQYNAYYLNMVANEMFLDSSLQRSSVVSHAKLLNYTPQSTVSPSAVVDLVVSGIPSNINTLTLPRYSQFASEVINGKSYAYVNTDLKTTTVSNNTATFEDITIKQGVALTLTFNFNSATNLNSGFELPDASIDTSTLLVQVYPTPSSTEYSVYNLVDDYLSLTGDSLVYFLNEKTNGNYEISFGDDILGKKLINGSKIVVSYLTTTGVESTGANNFVLSSGIEGYTTVVNSISSSTGGKDREDIDSIKFTAPKSFFSNNRAVTKDDYVAILQQNKLGITFDAVSVWGGQENNPPIYGQIFIALKPTGGYNLTQTQKQRLIKEVISPISVVTIEPTIVDPDYTYIKIDTNVYYDPQKTLLTSSELQNQIKATIQSFAANTLNTFNSTFMLSDLSRVIEDTNQAIITNEINIQVQKKFYPNLTTPTSYKLYYGVPLKKGLFQSGIYSTPSLQFRDPDNLSNIISDVYLEEIPSSTGGVESISIINAGFGYQYAPTVTISGDGSGATAVATINGDGTLRSINVLTPGTGYSGAVITLTPQANDTTGTLGNAIAQLEGRFGTLRLYYYNNRGVKVILREIGTVDYNAGIIQLNSFNPLNVDDPLGLFGVTANPQTTIISSSFNRIITVDPFDPTSIVVNMIAKNQ